MAWLLTNLIAALILPPLNLLLLCGGGLLLWHRRPVIARWLVTCSFLGLWLLSTPYISNGLLRTLEGKLQPPDVKTQPADAIVVLGAGTHFNAPEYGGDTVSEPGLVRLRYAARLAHETGKPVMVTGGAPEGNAGSEAQQMKDALEQDFHTTVTWTEGESRNTAENAAFCYRKLSPLGIRRIYLVTQAWHMPRAIAAFRAAGFEVVPAPTDFPNVRAATIMDFVPSTRALMDSRWFLHESLGLAWYFLKS